MQSGLSLYRIIVDQFFSYNNTKRRSNFDMCVAYMERVYFYTFLENFGLGYKFFGNIAHKFTRNALVENVNLPTVKNGVFLALLSNIV